MTVVEVCLVEIRRLDVSMCLTLLGLPKSGYSGALIFAEHFFGWVTYGLHEFKKAKSPAMMVGLSA